MGTKIHPTAVVDPEAELADGVEIGPHAVIEGGVKVGRGTRILPGAWLARGTELGEKNLVHVGAAIGGEPQDLEFEGVSSGVRIGDGNTIREYVQIHRGTKEGTFTVVGNDCYLMACSHVAHNCRLGDGVIMTNCALLAGYVEIEDRAVLSGYVGVHQFARVGTLAMVAGGTRLSKDAPPYMLVHGESTVRGVNMVGLRRCEYITPDAIRDIRRAYRVLFRSGLSLEEALRKLEDSPCPEVKHLVEFIRSSKRGICRPRRRKAP